MCIHSERKFTPPPHGLCIGSLRRNSPAPLGRYMVRLGWHLIVGFTIVLAASDLKADDGPAPFLGSWAYALPDGSPAWLNIERADGTLRGVLLWSVGSARPVDELSVEGGLLSFRRHIRWRSQADIDTVIEIDKPFSARRSGEALELTFRQTSVDSTLVKTITLMGKRMPPLPARPNLKKVVFGPPIQLFNGIDLSGWQLSHAGKTNGWSVQAGVLVNETPKQDFSAYGQYGNLRTVREFEDFQLTIDYNVPPRGNSGIYLRGMYEAQVVDRDSPMQGIQGPGAIFGRIAPTSNAGKPGGQWNQYVLTLVDRHVTVVLNGQMVIDNRPIVGCTGGGLSADDTMPGPILLQGDHTAVRFRQIVLRPVVRQ